MYVSYKHVIRSLISPYHLDPSGIRYGLLGEPALSSMIFPARNLHVAHGFSTMFDYRRISTSHI